MFFVLSHHPRANERLQAVALLTVISLLPLMFQLLIPTRSASSVQLSTGPSPI